MMMVAATPFAGLLELFVVVPLGIIAAICGVECAGAYRRRPRRPWGR
ncbi:hypothetical protein [Lichenibacterium dinghuense]|nr:hypothetical protein [Lichenibacterium sp. 6Y81]